MVVGKFKKIFFRLFCLVTVMCLLISCFGCAGSGKQLLSVPAQADIVYPYATDMSSHYCVTDNLKPIAASGLITMLFDENSSAIGVRITEDEQSRFWSALPVAVNGETPSDEAEILGMEIIHNGKVYCLNSQDSSVSCSNAFWSNIENGFQVVYYLSDEPSCIANVAAGSSDEIYSAAAADNILFKAVATYTLKDGCFYADLEWVNLGNQSDVLVNISFLEYFGAEVTAQQGDFIFVPDGSGALIDLFVAEPVEPVSVSVYGNDFGESNNLTGIIPAYGMKSGNDAFVAVIENGDAVAKISANKAPDGSNYHRVGAEFTVTPSQVQGSIRYFSDVSYDGNITVCYRFLNGSDANYATMAAACREQLIRNHTLSSGSVSDENGLPVLVNVVGQSYGGGLLGFNKNLTTYSQAQDILNRIKSKGINNVYLRYTGALSGGVNSENSGDASLITTLGSSKKFSELDEYAAGLNFNVFADVSLVSDSASSLSGNKDLFGKKIVYDQSHLLYQAGFSDELLRRTVVDSLELNDIVLSTLETLNGYDATGFCVGDAGSVLYTDLKNKLDRQKVSEIIAEEIEPLSSQNMIMIDKGNFYSLKNADVISSFPMSCKRSQSASYTSIPFVQIVLHGIVEFSAQPLNFSSASRSDFLKVIEYGAIPCFALTNDNYDDSEEYNNIFNSDISLNYMYSCYNQAYTVLNDLRSSRITDHYLVAYGVYCTEYESTTKIYVNYTENPITVSGITVEPMNFFRVN